MLYVPVPSHHTLLIVQYSS